MKNTQTSVVLHHLENNGSITSMEAFELFGATRLSAIIYSLRKAGYDIETEPLEVMTRYGRPTTVARYLLRK